MVKNQNNNNSLSSGYLEQKCQKELQKGIMRGKNYVLSLRHGLFENGLGVKLTNRTGSSLEFMEHRDYLAGDDLRQLDWNVYARTEKLTVKLFREEINPTLDIIVDGSASMNLLDTDKLATTLNLIAVFATAAFNGNYLTKLWKTDESVHELSCAINETTTKQLSKELTFNSNKNPLESFEYQYGAFQHNGIRIFISDLLFAGVPKQLLKKLSLNASAVIIIQVLSSEDISPSVTNSTLVEDSESKEIADILVDEDAVKKYKQAFALHQQNWERGCKEAGVVLITLNAEDFQNDLSLKLLIEQEILRFA
ncbi:DUF58 domain-containing protein [Lentisphaerota bacterium WC36G]|nr:DUF58 domain-containing protein [Lentisphaerae bacterium WC36]